MTYRELLITLEKMQKLTPGQHEQVMQSTITVHDRSNDEYYPADFNILLRSDVLDDGHPVISFGEAT